MRGEQWNEATYAFRAAWDSQAKCPSETRSPLWAYWLNLSWAAALLALRNYSGALNVLGAADTWRPEAQAYAARTNQKSAFNGDVTLANQLRSAIANAASQPPPQYAPPARSYDQAAPSGCDDDSIETVGDDGAILEMLSGAVYRVQDYDTATSSIWLTADDVLICGNKIIDKDEDGDTVDAYRVR